MKAKRLVKLCKEQIRVKNLDAVITTFKPPIFWKDKETVKQQIRAWSYNQAEALTYDINEIELLIKKYPHNSINILSNFIIDKTSSISN
jgi:DNA polymerase-3 subunit delta|tara:strand:- start:265 stop:531 length:267 start_codon:yes stop_codon:yes gene_type:complete